MPVFVLQRIQESTQYTQLTHISVRENPKEHALSTCKNNICLKCLSPIFFLIPTDSSDYQKLILHSARVSLRINVSPPKKKSFWTSRNVLQSIVRSFCHKKWFRSEIEIESNITPQLWGVQNWQGYSAVWTSAAHCLVVWSYSSWKHWETAAATGLQNQQVSHTPCLCRWTLCSEKQMDELM